MSVFDVNVSFFDSVATREPRTVTRERGRGGV